MLRGKTTARGFEPLPEGPNGSSAPHYTHSSKERHSAASVACAPDLRHLPRPPNESAFATTGFQCRLVGSQPKPQMSLMGVEPMRSRLQWILSPHP